MLWVDSGTINGLVGADVKEECVQGVDNAMNIAVDANNVKVYWTGKDGVRVVVRSTVRTLTARALRNLPQS